MLNVPNRHKLESRFDDESLAYSEAINSPSLDLDALLAIARRQYRVVLLFGALFFTIGLVYLLTAVPKYTATVSVLIESRKNQDQLSASIAELNFDTGAIDSQVEVIKSDNVALAVAKALSLDTDPEFNNEERSLFGIIFGGIRNLLDVSSWFTSSDIAEEAAKLKALKMAAEKLKDNMDVKRLARTYVLTISYTSPSPSKASSIANAYADAYFRDQLEARYEITKRASGWLNDRIAELKENSLRSDLAVQRFKAANGIIDTRNANSASGTSLISDQQLMEITTQISLARSETARMEARLQQINDILKTGKTDGAVTESLGSPIINDLRTKYLKASKTSSELAARLGNNHYQVISLRNEMAQYDRLIFDELQRFAETYVSDLEIARGREKSLNEALADLVGQKALSNEVMVSLRELEREADVFKSLYQTFLQRYQDAIQRESFPTSEARIISPAASPEKPSAPKKLLVIILSVMFGLMAGIGIAAWREFKDRAFRTGSQVKDELGLHFIGMLSALDESPLRVDSQTQSSKHIQPITKNMRHILDAPLSSFAEILRASKVEIDLSTEKADLKSARVIGIVSVLPGEGKTTVSKNYASLLAFLGSKTLLIDGDVRNPGMTRSIASHAKAGLLDVISGDIKFQDAILLEPDSGLHVLPCVVKKKLLQSSMVISSKRMKDFIDSISEYYDYIVIDLPPLGPVVDVRAASHLLDGFLFVIEWGKTARSLVKNCLQNEPDIYNKCVGVLFNKVDDAKVNMYQSYESKGYYYGKYRNYYVDVKKAS